VVNVETAYRSLDPSHRTPDVVEQFRRMAAIESDHIESGH
jgi:cyclase